MLNVCIQIINRSFFHKIRLIHLLVKTRENKHLAYRSLLSLMFILEEKKDGVSANDKYK